ncbi:mercury methylation ferredoxin HgcB [Methanosphaerula palustris]|uniref:4Fe-4S ferredoxin iron-sulfur binding domain protein n=1 Tax=Methanosphaerula palustris (strain ATCC BAA-1556 / DSM 19958 / E1-9c) TaxID=521011 RepID=B8GGX8_METPE|nr:mercury methylation ferredoxin HgcB [Methanosphaerula palustris]ACL16383.1 4Fe-4S ferredoxin iron-sulfur binding domain protein [Methanosphaerula palustris E1-9c]
MIFDSYSENTLAYDSEQCVNCGACSTVCPHRVFTPGKKAAILTTPAACMECGACQVNCPTGAITVESGVGCASALIRVALTGKGEETCDCCSERELADERSYCEGGCSETGCR